MTKQNMELNLIMIYINGWEEISSVIPGAKVFRSWKNYPFEILNELERQNLIRQYPRSLIINNEGISKAQGLIHQYLNLKPVH